MWEPNSRRKIPKIRNTNLKRILSLNNIPVLDNQLINTPVIPSIKPKNT